MTNQYGNPANQPQNNNWQQNPPPPNYNPGMVQVPQVNLSMQPLVTIGSINVTQNTIYTTSGTCPISHAVFTLTDLTTTTESIPTWAIVLMIVFILFCLLGLLFLLVKEKKTTGYIQITVQNQNFLHTEQIPVTSVAAIQDINARVNYARSLVAAQPM